jgi:hypothetical protein
LLALGLFRRKPERADRHVPAPPYDTPDLGVLGLRDAAGTGPKDPDVAMCKLSLTHDEARHPCEHKGPFGYDFEPFM